MSAFLIGLLAASSLVIGATIALAHRVSQSTLGLIMAFGSGVLISAVAYDLVADAFATSGVVGIPAGMLCGAFAFFLGDLLIDRAGGKGRKSSTPVEGGSAKAIVLGTVLDGLPESIVIGLSVLSGEGVSVAVVVAVFLSNLPSRCLRRVDWPPPAFRAPRSCGCGSWSRSRARSRRGLDTRFWAMRRTGRSHSCSPSRPELSSRCWPTR